MKKFPIYKQLDSRDCGPTCLQMVVKFYGKSISLSALRTKCNINKLGVSLYDLSKAAESLGLKTLAATVQSDVLLYQSTFPIIIPWNENHFVVLYKVEGNKIYIADPAKGKVVISKDDFLKGWSNTSGESGKQGIVLFIERSQQFLDLVNERESKVGLKTLVVHLAAHKKLFIQLFLGLATGSILQLLFPFLTQAIVDVGINTKNINFITLILIAQIMLFLGRIGIEFLRGWILLHISTRVNITLVSDFLFKLIQLPISFFESRRTGDILQRIGDQNRIESFLTGTSLNTLFSILNFTVFSIVIIIYNVNIFLIFLIGSVLYALWVTLFLKYRKSLDYKIFDYSSRNQSKIIQLISGINDIKLNNCERSKRWEWERIQAGLFKLSIKTLSINQYQQAGALFLNEGKNIVITYVAATSVISGDMTLGAMLSIQYIIGQMNSPIEQLIQFMRSYQDAKISLDRLNEIYAEKSEEPIDNDFLLSLPKSNSIQIKNVSFSYASNIPPVLGQINLDIPEGKTTAIVGTSGSGKTTLLKLLLKFYEPQDGNISVGGVSLSKFSHSFWRSNVGVVLQDGFIFSGTIASNIAIEDGPIDEDRLYHAAKVANVLDFIESTPKRFDTVIGQEGVGISQGQKQRILIARAIYKNPKYILFDEATNSLDANNEKIIMSNLLDFFIGKTVIIVAHRLSTVKNADQIILLDKGKIIESGTHSELVAKSGAYYNLVKNQLELGS